MRAVPPGIELRRARSGDVETVIGLIEGEIARYAEWAPGWSPPAPSAEMRERLNPLYEDDARAWTLLACGDDGAVVVASILVITVPDPRVPPEGTIYLWQMF